MSTAEQGKLMEPLLEINSASHDPKSKGEGRRGGGGPQLFCFLCENGRIDFVSISKIGPAKVA